MRQDKDEVRKQVKYQIENQVKYQVKNRTNHQFRHQIKGKISTVPGCLLFYICAFLLLLSMTCPGQAQAESGLTSYYQKSLHFSGAGMRYWYEGKNGFMTLTKVPYTQAGCTQCHASSCDQCHGTKDKTGKVGFSTNEARKNATCFGCHLKEKLVIELSQNDENKDVHTAARMSCITCHKDPDIHGDGVARQSFQDTGVITTSCESCHVGEKTKGPRFDPEIRAHKRHKKSTELHCNACHVKAVLTCYNCHFSEFMKTRSQNGNFIPTSNPLMLINHQGKVTAATAMVLVHDKKTYVSYTPYFTHNIMKKGRDCQECHGNAAIQLLKKGEKIPVSTFENGRIQFWSGVIPIADDILQFQFLDKRKGEWIPLNTGKPDIERYTHQAGPLSEKQIKILKVSFGGGNPKSQGKSK
ncbi:MAG: hypothetical protein AB1611_15845 [bacterium]